MDFPPLDENFQADQSSSFLVIWLCSPYFGFDTPNEVVSVRNTGMETALIPTGSNTEEFITAERFFTDVESTP